MTAFNRFNDLIVNLRIDINLSLTEEFLSATEEFNAHDELFKKTIKIQRVCGFLSREFFKVKKINA